MERPWLWRIPDNGLIWPDDALGKKPICTSSAGINVFFEGEEPTMSSVTEDERHERSGVVGVVRSDLPSGLLYGGRPSLSVPATCQGLQGKYVMNGPT